MKKLIPFFGHPNLWRDPESGVILNKDPLKRKIKETVDNLDNKYNKMEEDVNNIKQSIDELKNMLIKYLNKENNN